MRHRTLAATAGAGALLAAGIALPAGAFTTSVQPYAKPVESSFGIKPLLSVADRIPVTGTETGEQYQMVGLPDGLGAFRLNRQRVAVYMNHEFGNTVQSEPLVGGPLQRGAFVGRVLMTRQGEVTTGDRAYDHVYAENSYVGPAPDASNSTPAFGRFCSGFLADERVGFDEPIYLTGEEADGAGTFDGRGGQTVAVVDNRIHTLPRFGRFSKENTVVVPGTGARTVAYTLEDGPSGPESQLYMYVGRKDPDAKSVLRRNGLDNGRLYTFVVDGFDDEGDIRKGSVKGRWVEIPGAKDMTEAELDAASKAVGAFGFVRIEDGAANPARKGEFFFVTTGGTEGVNRLGRVYRLRFKANDPEGGARLTVVDNADAQVAAGGDTALSPDNVDHDGEHLMVQEDGTAETRAVMAQKGRDGSIWQYHTNDPKPVAERVAELNPPARDGAAVGPGVWETSGIIDVKGLIGPRNVDEAWLFDVQAHRPTAAPAPNTVEDGQLLLMTQK